MGRYRTLINHFLFWVIFLNVAFVYNSMDRNKGVFTVNDYLDQYTQLYTYVEYGRVILTFYLSLWVFTHWFFPRQIFIIFLQVVVLGIFDSTLNYVLSQRIVGPLTGQWLVPSGVSSLNFITEDLTVSWLYVMMPFLFRHLQDHYRNEALQNEKNAIELAYLKSQLNPHFLFNSMNNLYGLALTEPARTPDAILKLSELMRYMLYESNETHVALTQEINYLNSYIALEKLRYEGEVHVNFTVDGLVNGQRIAPLLLISFVENAFKHGNVADAQHPIKLHLTAHSRQLTFTAENYYAPHS